MTKSTNYFTNRIQIGDKNIHVEGELIPPTQRYDPAVRDYEHIPPSVEIHKCEFIDILLEFEEMGITKSKDMIKHIENKCKNIVNYE